MSSRVSAYIRQNVLGLIAIYLALGGLAVASHPGGQNTITSADIVDGEVKQDDVGQGAVASPEIKNDSVVNGDIAPDSLTGGRIADATLSGADVANNSLTGADIDESTLVGVGGSNPTGPAGGDLTGTYPNPQIAPDAVTAFDLAAGSVGTSEVANESLTKDDLRNNSINGVDIEDGTLSSADVANGQLVDADMAPNSLTGTAINESTLGQVPAATLGGLGRWKGGATCDPISTTFITCDFVSINLPSASRVLVLGVAKAENVGDDPRALGSCRLATNISDLPASTVTVGVEDEDVAEHGEVIPLIAITGPIGPGAIDFAIRCNEGTQQFTGLNIIYRHVQIAAVALSPG